MNLLATPRARRIFVYGTPVDMRIGFIGLFQLIRDTLKEDPASGDLFVFIGMSRRILRCLLWDRTGYVTVSKRLERGRFRIRGLDKLELDEQRFQLLFDGVKTGGIVATV